MMLQQRCLFAAIYLLILLSPLPAQPSSRPPLQGGVKEEVINPQYRTQLDNQLHIFGLAADIVGQVMLLNVDLRRRVPAADGTVYENINKDRAELDKYKRSKTYSAEATKYDPCIEKGVAAIPHIIKAYESEMEVDRLRVSHTGTNAQVKALVDAGNREASIAWELQKAANECFSKMTPNQPWNREPQGNPPSGNPSNPPRNGSDSTSYYPRIPDPPLRSPCQPDGPGGYDFCNNPNPPPIGCDCSNRTSKIQPKPPQKQVCGPEPDWVRKYKAEGATPSLRYQVGFNQGVAKCLQDQCTIQNLALAVSVAAFPQVRGLLALGASANFISAIVNPPGFSPNPDPYSRGNEEGSNLCNWMLKLAVPVNARRFPLAGPGGKIPIPPGFKFYQAVRTIKQWLPKINTSGCTRNCGAATENSVRVMFGQPAEAAPANPAPLRGWTDQQMETAMGAKFKGTPATDVEMYTALNRVSEGTVGVISADSLGPEPGHFFWFVKANNTLQFWDGQTGVETMPGNWKFRWMVVGNPLER